MLKRIAILTGSIAALGASVAFATPTLTKGEFEMAQEREFHKAVSAQGAREPATVSPPTGQMNPGPGRSQDSAPRVQSPNAPFNWNP